MRRCKSLRILNFKIMGFKVITHKSLSRITSIEDLKRIRQNRNDEIPLFEKVNYELRNSAKNPSSEIEAFIRIDNYLSGELASVKSKLERNGFCVKEKESLISKSEPKIKYWEIITKEQNERNEKHNKKTSELGDDYNISNNTSFSNAWGSRKSDYPPKYPTARNNMPY